MDDYRRRLFASAVGVAALAVGSSASGRTVSPAPARVRDYDSRTQAAATALPSVVTTVRTGGYATAGDGGDALYKRVGSRPSHAGKFQSADGAWWEIAERTVNPLMFGAVGDGTTDCTAAFQAAAAYANATLDTGELFVPAGVYLISATVQMGRLSLRGGGAGSRIRPTITDGSPVLNFAAGANFFAIYGLRIDSEIDGRSFEAGAINAQNCTGIRIQSSARYSARFVMRDVVVRGCKVGHDITGFIATLENVWAYYCETGLIGSTMNSSRLHLRFEQCRKDIALSNSDGVHIDQMISEGAVLQSGVVTSTFDDCNGLVINALYLEQVRDVPFITFGGTTVCTGVSIEGVYVAMADNPSASYDAVALAFDRVNGLEISGFFSTGSRHSRYSTTANTKNIRDNTISSADAWGPHDASRNLGPARNLFPNPNFDLWFRGWPRIDIVRQTPTQETTIVRRGRNALRMTMTAGEANGYVAFRFDDGYLGAKLAGKTVTAYAWIWVPNSADFSPQAGPLQPTLVDFGIFFDGAGTTTLRTGGASTVRGAWNLFRVTATLPTDCTRIDIMPRILINSGSASGS
jgi:hypothetical protein